MICATAVVISSCKVTVYSVKTDPPELDLPRPEAKVAFVNYFDYTLPAYIRARQEVTYMQAVRGFIYGLQSVFGADSTVSLVIADTLANRFIVNSMQDSSFRDTIRAVCTKFNADLLIALDSISLWFDWQTYADDDEEILKTKDFYLYSDNYVTLYSRDGDVIDRSKVQEGMFYGSRLALSEFITIGPSLSRAAVKAGALNKGAGEDYAGKFYPWDTKIPYQMHNNGPFAKSNEYILQGDPVKAVEPLRRLTGSANKRIAGKAKENLETVYRILDDRRASQEVHDRYKR